MAPRRWSEGPARATEECESRTAGLEARCSAKGQSMRGPSRGPDVSGAGEARAAAKGPGFSKDCSLESVTQRPIDARAPAKGPGWDVSGAGAFGPISEDL